MARESVKKPDHSATRKADPYAFEASHKRLAWLLRLSVTGNGALAAAVISLAAAVWTLAPQKTVEVALLRADPSDNRVYRVEPISREVDGFDLLMEYMARRFVKLVLEIDPVSQKDRFDEAFAMAGRGYRERFIRERIDSGELDDAIGSRLNRSIAVESAQRLSERDGVFAYAVDFVQIDERRGKEIGRKPLRAYLSMTARPHEAREKDKFTNPLGILVLDLVLKEKGTEEANLR